MTTTVWLCEPRSHGRRKEASPLPGRHPQFCRTPSIAVSGFVLVWARSIFSSSFVVVRAWCLEFGGVATGGGAVRARVAHAVRSAVCECGLWCVVCDL